ncbi:MAG: LysR family transcriptional regulator [Lachnospiraceae bacterium]|nr:LysR family transcriptional regulator [Lachnospiraceae bacterium]
MTIQQMKYVIEVAERGSMNEAARSLFISQPSLSENIKEIEKELGITIFARNNRGITLTTEGREFIGYARQVLEQYRLMENRYTANQDNLKKFYVSGQHYTFAVEAFSRVIKKEGIDAYDFAFYETRTYEVIMDVKNMRSEIGVLYLNDFNEKVLTADIKENNLEFTELFSCKTYVYMSASHPLANKDKISFRELDGYPCLSFDQGDKNSFYYAEEVFSTYPYKKIIHINDRSTALNMMTILNGFTLCSGVICEELNGEGYIAIPLDSDERMRIGYVKRADSKLSDIAKKYIKELKHYGSVLH